MSQVRLGIITQIDIEGEFGVIVDNNGQDINFSLKDIATTISLNAKVTFQIKLSGKGLIATDICEV